MAVEFIEEGDFVNEGRGKVNAGLGEIPASYDVNPLTGVLTITRYNGQTTEVNLGNFFATLEQIAQQYTVDTATVDQRGVVFMGDEEDPTHLADENRVLSAAALVRLLQALFPLFSFEDPKTGQTLKLLVDDQTKQVTLTNADALDKQNINSVLSEGNVAEKNLIFKGNNNVQFQVDSNSRGIYFHSVDEQGNVIETLALIGRKPDGTLILENMQQGTSLELTPAGELLLNGLPLSMAGDLSAVLARTSSPAEHNIRLRGNNSLLLYKKPGEKYAVGLWVFAEQSNGSSVLRLFIGDDEQGRATIQGPQGASLKFDNQTILFEGEKITAPPVIARALGVTNPTKQSRAEQIWVANRSKALGATMLETISFDDLLEQIVDELKETGVPTGEPSSGDIAQIIGLKCIETPLRRQVLIVEDVADGEAVPHNMQTEGFTPVFYRENADPTYGKYTLDNSISWTPTATTLTLSIPGGAAFSGKIILQNDDDEE